MLICMSQIKVVVKVLQSIKPPLLFHSPFAQLQVYLQVGSVWFTSQQGRQFGVSYHMTSVSLKIRYGVPCMLTKTCSKFLLGPVYFFTLFHTEGFTFDITSSTRFDIFVISLRDIALTNTFSKTLFRTP